jgi:hypothetical protein
MEEDFTAFEAKARGEDTPKEEAAEEPASEEPASEEPASEEPELTEEQKRIKELETQIADRDKEREAAAQRELERLRAENEALRTPEDDNDGDEQSDGPPNPGDYEYGDADSEYIADLAEWRAIQKIEARDRKRALEAEFNKMQEGWNAQLNAEETKSEYPDFDEKVVKAADRGDWKLTPEGSILVRSSPVGAHVAYYLASNPAESERIAQLGMADQAREIGRIEGRFLSRSTATDAQPARETPTAQPSKAPPPPKQTVRGAGGRFDIDPATDDFSGFDKMAKRVLESQ